MLNNIDLYIVGALFLITALVFIGTRVGVMPKKSLPVVAGAVFGALGIGLFARWRRNAVDAQIKDLKDRIAKREEALAELQQKRKLADDELAAARAGLDNQLAAVKLQRQAIAEKLEKDNAAIDEQGAAEAHDTLLRQIKEEQDFKRRSSGIRAVGG